MFLTIQILFLGERGRDIRGDIAVDTLNVRNGQCEGRNLHYDVSVKMFAFRFCDLIVHLDKEKYNFRYLILLRQWQLPCSDVTASWIEGVIAISK